MDNNTQTPAAQTVPDAPTQPESSQTPSSGSKMILWFAIGLVMVVALVAGIYFYLNKTQTNKTFEETVVQTPVPSPKEDLEGDLNSINVDSATESSDFAPIDQDLQSL